MTTLVSAIPLDALPFPEFRRRFATTTPFSLNAADDSFVQPLPSFVYLLLLESFPEVTKLIQFLISMIAW